MGLSDIGLGKGTHCGVTCTGLRSTKGRESEGEVVLGGLLSEDGRLWGARKEAGPFEQRRQMLASLGACLLVVICKGWPL